MNTNEISLADAYGQNTGAAAAVPDNEMSIDEAYGKPSFLQEQFSNFANAGKSIWNLAGQAGQGIVNAVEHPVDTANEVAQSIANTTPQDISSGLQRSIRSMPLIGTAYNQLTGVTPQQQKQIDEADAKHQLEHPLTDFLQKSVPMMLMPGGIGKQVAILAADTFTKSVAQGKSYADATHDALNTAILAGSFLKLSDKLPGAAETTGKAIAKDLGVSGDAVDRYLADPQAVQAAGQYIDNPEGLKNLIDRKVAPINQAVTDAKTNVDMAQQAADAANIQNPQDSLTDTQNTQNERNTQAAANLQNAQDSLTQSQNAQEAVNKLGPDSTESLVNSIQNGRNIEAQKQLGSLDPDLLQTIKDTGVAKQFVAPTTAASRKTIIGGVAGEAVGHLAGAAMGAPEIGRYVGAAAGAATGYLADKYGGQAVKTALDAGIKIQSIANSPFVQPIMRAAQESPNALAVVHYMLSQTNPEYQALVNGQEQ